MMHKEMLSNKISKERIAWQAEVGVGEEAGVGTAEVEAEAKAIGQSETIK
jgi:hypothetical protein